MSAQSPATLVERWRRATLAPPSSAAFLVKTSDGWISQDWQDAGRQVEELAAGFLTLGIRKGDRVAIIARTRVEWSLCDWALLSIGALVVPIYPTSSTVECAYIIGNSGARTVVCEDAGQRAKIEPAWRELEALERIVMFEGPVQRGEVALEALREQGRALLADSPTTVDQARAALTAEDPATVIYTSGTTGPPKGCILTHRNYGAMVDMVAAVEGLILPGDRVLLHLPLAHTFARLISFLGPATGLTVAFCPDVRGISDALASVRPTLLPTIPRLYERFAAAMRSALHERTGMEGRVAKWALRTGRRASARERAGRRVGPFLRAQTAVADGLVLSKVRDRLGGEVRYAISGGAPLAQSVAEFFHGLGILVLEGYGLTECTTAATFNRPTAFRFGTVGLPLPGVEVATVPDGEVLIRGENVFKGYYGDEAATRAVLTPDGWLSSGDLGKLDPDGFLTITGRKKDIIVTAAGKNISPLNIEEALKASPYISEALVIGDGRPYLVALLVPADEAVDLTADGGDGLHALLEHEVAAVNRRLGAAEQVRRFAVLPRTLSEEASELTPTLKVRRHVCEQHFSEEIERLYRGAKAEQ